MSSARRRFCTFFFFFQAEDGIRDLVRSRGLGDVYKRQGLGDAEIAAALPAHPPTGLSGDDHADRLWSLVLLSLIHI